MMEPHFSSSVRYSTTVSVAIVWDKYSECWWVPVLTIVLQCCN